MEQNESMQSKTDLNDKTGHPGLLRMSRFLREMGAPPQDLMPLYLNLPKNIIQLMCLLLNP